MYKIYVSIAGLSVFQTLKCDSTLSGNVYKYGQLYHTIIHNGRNLCLVMSQRPLTPLLSFGVLQTEDSMSC